MTSVAFSSKNMTSSFPDISPSADIYLTAPPQSQSSSHSQSPSSSSSDKKKQRSYKKVYLDGFGCNSYRDERDSKTAHHQQRSDERTKAFDILGNKTKMEKVLTCTQLCSSVTKGETCRHGSRCRFAHSLDELKTPDCVFGDLCNFVYCQPNGIWVQKNGCRPCKCLHPNESLDNFYARSGLDKYKISSAKTPGSRPIAKTPIAPMKNNVAFSLLQEDDEEQTDIKPVKLFSDVVDTPLPSSPSPVVSDDEEVVIRVPKEMAEVAMEAAIKAGKFNIRVEITN
jgi:hypothetical protein